MIMENFLLENAPLITTTAGLIALVGIIMLIGLLFGRKE